MISKDKHVLLRLESRAAAFFKREQQFNRSEYEFVSEDLDSSVTMRMYYNNTDEIKHLIQGWMPQIKMLENSEVRQSIYGQIKTGCDDLFLDTEFENTINLEGDI